MAALNLRGPTMRKISTYLFVSLLALAVMQPTFAKATGTNESANQKAILFHVNEYRAKHHLNPLRMNTQMSIEAEKHSQDMARHAVPFGHQGFNQRIKRLFGKIKDCKGGAENVAYNYKDGKTVVSNWLTSRGHRKNIEGNYNLTGIGLARDKNGKLYFTQIFIRV